MINVAIVGLGMMGRVHLQAYEQLEGVRVVAVCDQDPKRAAGDLSGSHMNIETGAGDKLDMDRIRGTTQFDEVLAMDDVDVVDICVPTPLHVDLAVRALASGKHVLVEKPLARTSKEGQRIAEAAAGARGKFMPAMCMRFWPQWVYLKQAVEDGRFGKCLGATFQRLSSPPPGWFQNGEMSGGALWDLHIHDTDFVCHLFGQPEAVTSGGYAKTSGEIDHVSTLYHFKNVPMVLAEGSWAYADEFGFHMRYVVNFENATLKFDIGAEQPLVKIEGGKVEPIDCGSDTGYLEELRYFLDCVANDKPIETITAADAVAALRVAEAERRSIDANSTVSV